MLTLIIMNLLENAVVHSESSRPVRLQVSQDSETVIFEIFDYGIGISEDLVHTIFDSSPSDTSGSYDSRKGMGIGLSICKTIILAHNGTITAQNHAQGAVFTFTLPTEQQGKDRV